MKTNPNCEKCPFFVAYQDEHSVEVSEGLLPKDLTKCPNNCVRWLCNDKDHACQYKDFSQNPL